MIERLGDSPTPAEQCRHPEHDTPTHVHLTPGVYLHTCPECWRRVVFRVGAPTTESAPGPETPADDQAAPAYESPPPRMQVALGVLEQLHAFGFGLMGELIPMPLKVDEVRLRSSAIEALRNYLAGETSS